MLRDSDVVRHLLQEEELLAVKVGGYAQKEDDPQVRQLLQLIQASRERHVDRLRAHLEEGGDDREQP